MNEAAAFDTHRFIKHLTATGFTEQQAESLAEEQVLFLNANLANRADMARIEADIAILKADIARIEVDMATKADIARIEIVFKADTAQAKHELTIRFGIMLATGLGILFALLRLT